MKKFESPFLTVVFVNLTKGFEPWGEDEETPSFDICDCYGVEFGYGDFTIEGIKDHRNKWIQNGAKWRWPKNKPENWSLEEQMKNIPEEFR